MAENAGSIFYTVDIETDKTLRAQDRLDQGFDKLQKGMDDTDRSASSLGGGLSKLALSIAAVVSAGAIREMAGLVQTYQEMAERVQMATSSQAEFEMVQKRLLNTANQTYRRLDEAQELYIRTADSLRSMGYSTSEALDVTDSMSLSFVTNAASADRASAAISALSKSVNTGKVAADQWETITSAIPTVIDDIAAASNRTSAEVRALGAAGKLTAQDLTEGLRKSLDANAEAAGKMAANLTDAGVRVRTALTQVLVSLEDQTGGLQAVTDGIISAANVMLEFGGDAEKMAGFLDTATTAATALSVVLASRLLAALSGYSAALVTQAAASVQATRAADANLRLAAAESAAAAAALRQAQATATATVGLSTHAAAVTALSAAQARATAAAAGFTAAQTAANAAARVGATVMGVLRGAMALLGGPAGVIFLAVGALAAFATSSAEAKPPVDLLTDSVNELGEAALRLQKIKIGEKLEELRGLGATAATSGASVEYLKSQLAQFPNSAKADEWRQRLAEQEAAAEGAGAELGRYEQRLKDIDKELENRKNGTPTAPGTPAEPTLTPTTSPAIADAAKKAADAIRDQIDALQQQADTVGFTASELEIYRLQLAGATDEQIRAAQSALAAVDAYEQQTEAADASAKAEAERRKTLEVAAKTVTPMRAAENQYLTDLQQYEDMLALKLISDQEYLMLKNQAETTYDAQRLAAQEAMFANASIGNAVLLDSINALGASATNVFSGILSGSMDGEQAMQALANTVFNSVIGSFVEMGIAQVKAILIGKTANAAAAAGYVASVTGQVAANTALAAQAAFASTAAIPIVGPAAAPGVAAAAGSAAAALGAPAIAGASASLAGGKALGGPVQADNMYRVNEGGKPEIFNAANGQQYMMPNQRGEVVSNADASSGGGSSVVINITNTTGAKVTQNETQMDDKRVIDIVIGDLLSDGDTHRAWSAKYGLQTQGR